jgi:hypothetical protein
MGVKELCKDSYRGMTVQLVDPKATKRRRQQRTPKQKRERELRRYERLCRDRRRETVA